MITPLTTDVRINYSSTDGTEEPSSSETDLEASFLRGQPQPLLEEDTMSLYVSYAKYAWLVGKWPLMVTLVNLFVLFIPPLVEGQVYFMLPFDRFVLGVFTAATWLATAVWLHQSAQYIDQQVQRYDQMTQYQQASQNEGNEMTTVPTATFVPDSENLYGQFARKLDGILLSPRKTTSTGHNSRAPYRATNYSSDTSLLVKWVYSLATLLLGTSFFMFSGTLMASSFANKSCDAIVTQSIDYIPPNVPNSTIDVQDIESFPENVQKWIEYRRNRGLHPRDGYYYDYDNEYYHSKDRISIPIFGFPVSYAHDRGTFALMKDGTTFLEAASPIDDDDVDAASHRRDFDVSTDISSFQSTHLVLVESPPNKNLIYHDDIVNPSMFIPVQSTIVDRSEQDGNGRTPTATQYCWTAASPKETAEEDKARTTPLYCVKLDSDGSSNNIDNVMIRWTDKIGDRDKFTAASYGDVILVANVGVSDNHREVHHEVVQVTPSTMDVKVVYRFTEQRKSVLGHDYYKSKKRRCVRSSVFLTSTVLGMFVWVVAGVLLSRREGLVLPGTIPIVFAVAAGIVVLADHVPILGVFWIIAGTLSFHAMIYYDGGGTYEVSHWIQRETYVCGLYSWITAILFWDFVTNEMSEIVIAFLFTLAISGFILDHPAAQIMGMVATIVGVVWICITPWLVDLAAEGVFAVLIGFGLIAVGSWFSRNRLCVAAICRHCGLVARAMASSRSSRTGVE